MPSTKVSDSTPPRNLVMPLSPCPTMMLDRIGIIGSTQGVNVSSSPVPKAKMIANRKLVDAMEPASPVGLLAPTGSRKATPTMPVFARRISKYLLMGG